MPVASNTKQIAHIDCAGGGQVWVDGTTLYVGHMRNPSGTSIYDIADPKNPRLLAHVPIPEGWHSHKVRAQNGIMIVNHEKLGPGGPADFTGGLGDLRRVEAGLAEADHQVDDRRQGRASLRLRRPLRLHLADGRRLHRQHRDDPRSRRSREAAGSRALVDSRPVAGGRRSLSVGRRRRAALPSSAAHGRPAVRQLLASRPVHPRHRRHGASRRRSRISTRVRHFRIRPTPACAFRKS